MNKPYRIRSILLAVAIGLGLFLAAVYPFGVIAADQSLESLIIQTQRDTIRIQRETIDTYKKLADDYQKALAVCMK